MDEAKTQEWFTAGVAGGGEAAVTNAAAGLLSAAVFQRVPVLGAVAERIGRTLNLTTHAQSLTYGPWSDFMMPSGGYKMPRAMELRTKVMANASTFGGNYLSMGTGLSVVGVFFHPFLLFLGIALFFGFRRAQSEQPVVMAGRTLSSVEKSSGMLIVTVLTVLLTGALETMVWIIGFAALIAGTHASFREPSVEVAIQMEQMNGGGGGGDSEEKPAVENV